MACLWTWTVLQLSYFVHRFLRTHWISALFVLKYDITKISNLFTLVTCGQHKTYQHMHVIPPLWGVLMIVSAYLLETLHHYIHYNCCCQRFYMFGKKCHILQARIKNAAVDFITAGRSLSLFVYCIDHFLYK